MKDVLIKGVAVIVLLLLRYNDSRLFRQIGLESGEVHFLRSLITFLYLIAIFAFIKELFLFWYRNTKRLHENATDNVVVGINNSYRLVIFVVATFSVLALFEINARDLFASLSIIAAAIAIISKDYLSNIIGGMLITFSNNISVGDHIRIGNNKGRVLDISITMFSLLTDDDDVVTLPNSTVYASEVVNYTKRIIKKTSIEFEINLEAIDTVSQLEFDLIATLADYQDSIEPDTYNLKAVSIMKDSIAFKFQYVLNLPDRQKEQEIRRKVIRRVVQIIKRT